MLPSFRLPVVYPYLLGFDMDDEQLAILLCDMTSTLEKLETRVDTLKTDYSDMLYDLYFFRETML